MPQPRPIRTPATSQLVGTNRTSDILDPAQSSAVSDPVPPSSASNSLPQLYPRTPEPFVEADAAAEFLRYSARTIKQMARDGRIPAHPFGTGLRRRWYFLISELAEHLRAQVNSAHGEAGRDETRRRVI